MGKGGRETLRLDVIPPAFEQLRRKRTAVNPCPMNSFRVRWRVCCARLVVSEIMEDALRMAGRAVAAVCLVSKKASPYVSYEAVLLNVSSAVSRWSFSVLMNW